MTPSVTAPTPTSASQEPVQIRPVRVGELSRFTDEALASAGPNDVVPVSSLRAEAQSRNPHAAPDDVALLVAYRGTRLVGYLGLLPGRLRLGGCERSVTWMSTWYVSPELRGQRAGYRLFQAARALGVDLFGTAFSRDAERVMRQAGFIAFGPVEFLTLDLRRVAPLAAPAVALRRRLRTTGRDAGRLAALAWTMDRALSRPGQHAVLRALLRGVSRRVEGVRAEAVETISPAAFGDADPPDVDRFVRDLDAVNWTIGYPWVEEGMTAASPDRAYHFSRERRLFRRQPLHFLGTGSNEPLGFALLSAASVRERTVVRLLDHRLDDERLRAAAIAAALRLALRHDADSVVLPATLRPELERHLLARLLLKRQTRGYLGLPADPDGDLNGRLGEIRLDYCDGDTPFNA